jgi:hypothetical protein
MIAVTDNSPRQINAALIAIKNEVKKEITEITNEHIEQVESNIIDDSATSADKTWSSQKIVNAGIPFGSCTTAAATVAKTVTVAPAVTALTAGTTVAVKMTNTNSVGSPTLNVNGTGAIAIKRYGTTNAGNNNRTSWGAGSVQLFTYDGTYWCITDFCQNAEWAASAGATGHIIASFATSAPSGYLACAGATVSRTTYAALWSFAQSNNNALINAGLFGTGDGSTTFKLPDLRGRFIEGTPSGGTLGAKIAAGLPEIQGVLALGAGSVNVYPSTCNGVWTGTSEGWGGYTGGVATGYCRTTFQFHASNSNSIYGNSTTVQPSAVNVNYFIKT